jgi:UDP-N-acetylmuramoyl-L-alanyl-D-glutamate--2,6-diaminopimelate ligase
LKLWELLQSFKAAVVKGSTNRIITGLTQDSRQVKPGMMFFAIQGAIEDGNSYIGEAVRMGAAAIISQDDKLLKNMAYREMKEAAGNEMPSFIYAPDIYEAMARCAASFYGFPNRKLKLIGITGTKGKTTVACMICEILKQAGVATGMIGTLGQWIVGQKQQYAGRNTTPDAIVLWQRLREMADAHVEYVIMEISSQAVLKKRILGLSFQIGIFTNLSPDHIGPGEHPDFANYKACKQAFFKQCQYAIYNGDDANWQDMIDAAPYATYRVGSREATLWAKPLEGGLDESDNYGFYTGGCASWRVKPSLPGKFSIENALAAMLCTYTMGISQEAILQGIQTVSVPGRMEVVPVKAPFSVWVDYAHNPDSIRQLLLAVRPICKGRIIALFGCGGNRSKGRRCEMGKISGELADFTILTEDNSRWEDPLAILKDIENGILQTKGKYVIIPDRKEAIAYGMSIAKAGDLLLLLGKGHETYQETRGVRSPFCERDIVMELSNRQAKEEA